MFCFSCQIFFSLYYFPIPTSRRKTLEKLTKTKKKTVVIVIVLKSRCTNPTDKLMYLGQPVLNTSRHNPILRNFLFAFIYSCLRYLACFCMFLVFVEDMSVHRLYSYISQQPLSYIMGMGECYNEYWPSFHNYLDSGQPCR